MHPAHGAGANIPGIRGLFYDGPPFRRGGTRVFAYLGVPDLAPGEKAPGIVLVHGGLGTAFPDWVKLWRDRGYAAIAIDTCGCVHADVPPEKAYVGPWPRHEHAGPPGWGGFDQIDEAIEDQWMYHAVADALLAHSLLAALPQVDAGRVGLTGISWGGIIACIVAGVDPCLRFVVPVYGCGFLDGWAGRERQIAEASLRRWLDLWDPRHYLAGARMPMLWMTGTNDPGFSLPSLQRSYRLAPGEHMLCVPVRMVHGHGGPGERPPEIAAFADSITRGSAPPARITAQGAHGGQVWAAWAARCPVVRADLNYTPDAGPWPDRGWHTVPAGLEVADDGTAGGRAGGTILPGTQTGRAFADVPPGATAFYLTLVDQRDLRVSSEHVE